MTRSIHFPALEPPANGSHPAVQESKPEKIELPPRTRNAIDALGAAAREIGLARAEFGDVIHSDTRHGKLIVVRGALQRAIKHLDVLIAHEEEAS